MNELKPEDVMRALECHSLEEISTCDDCPYCDTTEAGSCGCVMAKDALALLREKDAEIERLTAENEFHKSEIEEMSKDRLELHKAIARMKKYDGQWKKDLETARADAITEFAEKLKERMREVYPADIYDSDIDQIAYELKGESK